METAGFGSVDQSLNARRIDDYSQYNFAMQVDAGRFLPEKSNYVRLYITQFQKKNHAEI